MRSPTHDACNTTGLKFLEPPHPSSHVDHVIEASTPFQNLTLRGNSECEPGRRIIDTCYCISRCCDVRVVQYAGFRLSLRNFCYWQAIKPISRIERLAMYRTQVSPSSQNSLMAAGVKKVVQMAIPGLQFCGFILLTNKHATAPICFVPYRRSRPMAYCQAGWHHSKQVEV